MGNLYFIWKFLKKYFRFGTGDLIHVENKQDCEYYNYIFFYFAGRVIPEICHPQ
jgi:hypothetical protein